MVGLTLTPAGRQRVEDKREDARREWLRSRGVDVTHLRSYPEAPTGQGHTRTSFRPGVEYLNDPLPTPRSRR
jgi:hypothetical protein